MPCDTLIGDAGTGLAEDNRHSGWQSQLLYQTHTQPQLKGKKKEEEKAESFWHRGQTRWKNKTNQSFGLFLNQVWEVDEK